ncbi:MAG TPA: hypothetical protein VJR24_11515 [Gemmatimonadaceae bacterium]|nr:hypothetical protein [Gemmatimonadaceae bacterium]
MNPLSLEELPQLCARPADSHLERRNADACERRHFIVTQLFDVLEQERFPLVQLHLVERELDFLEHCFAVRRLLDRDPIQLIFIPNETLRAFAATPGDRATLVAHDLKQPCRKVLWIPASCEAPEGAHERRLDCFIRVVAVPEQSHGETVAPIAMPIDENGIKISMPSKNQGDNFGVRTRLH